MNDACFSCWFVSQLHPDKLNLFRLVVTLLFKGEDFLPRDKCPIFPVDPEAVARVELLSQDEHPDCEQWAGHVPSHQVEDGRVP